MFFIILMCCMHKENYNWGGNFFLTTAAIAFLASGHCGLSLRKSQKIEKELEACFQYSRLAFRAIMPHALETPPASKDLCCPSLATSGRTGQTRAPEPLLAAQYRALWAYWQYGRNRNTYSNTYVCHSNLTLIFYKSHFVYSIVFLNTNFTIGACKMCVLAI